MTERKIRATLAYGENISTWKLILLLGTIVFCMCGTILLFVIALDENSVEGMIFSVVPLIMLCVFLMMLIAYNKHRKKISLWLRDAVLLDAKCNKYDNSRGVNGGIKISISFTYNDKHLVRTSGTQNFHPYNHFADGYSNTYRIFVGKDIKILYSPKYDEVMIPYQ